MRSQAATALGDVTGVIHAAGVSPSQAAPATILSVDLYGTALVLEEFGQVIVAGGAGVVIASMSGHRLPSLTPEQDKALATTPVDELLSLPMLQADQVTDPLNAYQISKRGNSLRVMAEAVRRPRSNRPGERRRSAVQETEGGARGCALTHAWSVRGAARKASGNSSFRSRDRGTTCGAGGMPSAGTWIEQYGQCSSTWAATGVPRDLSGSGCSHLEPWVEQTSIQEAPLLNPSACDTEGASDATRKARMAIHAVSWRRARSMCTLQL
jgi:hypothetical protein